MTDLLSFLGRATGKIANAINSDKKLKCSNCNEITDHISISLADYMKADGVDDLGSTLLGLNDYNPSIPLIIGNTYACTKCQKVRLQGGILSNLYNKNTKGSYLKD